jgi:nitrogen PTS system EIIA component
MNLTVRDAAKILATSEKTIYRWVGQGILPAYRINSQYRFNKAELLEWATARKINVAQDLFAEPDAAKSPLPDLAQAIEEGGIHYRIVGSAKESVLRSIVGLLKLPDEVDRSFVLNILLAREGLGSTGVGEGIAIPHVRNPIVLGVPKASVSLCFLETPIDYGALDGQPVHTLFTVISPTMRAHLHLLSRLAFALKQVPFRQALLRQAPREEIGREIRRIEEPLGASPAGTAEREPSGRFYL